MKPLSYLLSKLSDAARRDDRSLPIIETDFKTAMLLRDILATEVSPDVVIPHDQPEHAFGIVAMYDGVKIKGRK